MFKQFILTLLFTVLSFLPISQIDGKILETNKISVINDSINRDSMVLFNITGTLYEPSTTLADHQWREFFAERVKIVITDSTKSQQLINRIKNEIVQKIPKKLVEEITPQLIADIQNQKIPVFGITEKQMATPYADNFGLITSKHLISIGINLEKTLSYSKANQVLNDKYDFAYGIIFSGKKPVGPALIAFLENNDYTDPQIVMVDNSLKTLENVEAALATKNYAFTGFHYTGANSRKDKFNPMLGIIEFIAFIKENKILSDQEAIQISLENPEEDYRVRFDNLIRSLAEEN